jgi:hypothetical protein
MFFRMLTGDAELLQWVSKTRIRREMAGNFGSESGMRGAQQHLRRSSGAQLTAQVPAPR